MFTFCGLGSHVGIPLSQVGYGVCYVYVGRGGGVGLLWVVRFHLPLDRVSHCLLFLYVL